MIPVGYAASALAPGAPIIPAGVSSNLRARERVPASPLLRVQDVSLRFGGIVALDGISFDLQAGGIYGLIGPNGAGKTTLFNCLSRLYQYQRGEIYYKGRSMQNLPVHAAAALGIGRTFQNLAVFKSMTVEQTVMVGTHPMNRQGFIATALRTRRAREEEDRSREVAAEMMRCTDVSRFANRLVTELPFPVQKRVEFARALASRPELLLLDEPAVGLNREETVALAALIREVRTKYGLTVLLVEHHMDLVMSISDVIVAMSFGRKLAEGTPDFIQKHEAVIAAYLGANP